MRAIGSPVLEPVTSGITAAQPARDMPVVEVQAATHTTGTVR
jgi:hypothetical protein